MVSVLYSCANNIYLRRVRDYGTLGPLLADAGVPAMIAMQGNIKMTMARHYALEPLQKSKSIIAERDRDSGRISEVWQPDL